MIATHEENIQESRSCARRGGRKALPSAHLPKVQNLLHQGAGPDPQSHAVLSHSCASHEEISPPCCLAPVGLVAYLKGGCFKTCNFVKGRKGY